MGLNDVMMNGYQPKENAEFGGRKKLVGDAVCQVSLIEAGKTKKWYILKGEVIHPIADEKGRPTTVEAGDEISKLYDPTDNEALQELMDDLFTAGIIFTNGATDEETFKNMASNTEGKLVYFKTWAKDKPADKIVPGKPTFYQNIKVASASKITPENSTPVLAF